MLKGLSTRGRVVVAVIFSALLFFLLISPAVGLITDLIFAPRAVQNVSVTFRIGAVDISWEPNSDYDLNGYIIRIEGSEDIVLSKEVTSYALYGLDESQTYDVSLFATDQSDRESEPTTFKTIRVAESQNIIVNEVPSTGDTTTRIYTNAIIITIVIFILNLWILFFKVTRDTVFSIGILPSMAGLSFLIFIQSLLFTINNPLNQLFLSIVGAVGFLVLNYFLFLTANILNGSFFNKIPLEQAGKAAQFIFSLVSTYLILIYAFGTYQNFLLRLVLVLPFIYYFSFSSIWSNKNATSNQAVMRAVTITIVMAITILTMSVWPIESVYAILSACVIFYILLNIALELRTKLSRGVWVEYGLLVVLILFLLLSNSTWGINGSLI